MNCTELKIICNGKSTLYIIHRYLIKLRQSDKYTMSKDSSARESKSDQYMSQIKGLYRQTAGGQLVLVKKVFILTRTSGQRAAASKLRTMGLYSGHSDRTRSV